MPIRARLSATRATAISTVTTCARATFGTQKYTPIHMQTRPHTCTPPLVRPSSATAPRRASLAPTAATAIRDRSAASHGLEPGPAAPSQSNEPSRRRPSCSRPHRPPSLVTREEMQPLDQPATAPLHKGVQMQVRQSRARGAAAAQRAAGSRFETC